MRYILRKYITLHYDLHWNVGIYGRAPYTVGCYITVTISVDALRVNDTDTLHYVTLALHYELHSNDLHSGARYMTASASHSHSCPSHRIALPLTLHCIYITVA